MIFRPRFPVWIVAFIFLQIISFSIASWINLLFIFTARFHAQFLYRSLKFLLAGILSKLVPLAWCSQCMCMGSLNRYVLSYAGSAHSYLYFCIFGCHVAGGFTIKWIWICDKHFWCIFDNQQVHSISILIS